MSDTHRHTFDKGRRRTKMTIFEYGAQTREKVGRQKMQYGGRSKNYKYPQLAKVGQRAGQSRFHHSAKSGGAERLHRNRTQPLQLRRERSARKTRCGQRTPPQFCRWSDVMLADATVTFLLARTLDRDAAKKAEERARAKLKAMLQIAAAQAQRKARRWVASDTQRKTRCERRWFDANNPPLASSSSSRPSRDRRKEGCGGRKKRRNRTSRWNRAFRPRAGRAFQPTLSSTF